MQNNHWYAGISMFIIIIIIIIWYSKHRGILAHATSVAGIIPPTEVTQRLVLWLGFYDSGTIYTARPASN